MLIFYTIEQHYANLFVQPQNSRKVKPRGAIWWQLLEGGGGSQKIFFDKEALIGLTNVIFPVCGEYWGLEPHFLKNFKLPSS